MRRKEVTEKQRAAQRRRWLLIGIGVPVVLAALYLFSGPFRRQNRARHDCDELLLGLQAYAVSFGQLPEGTLAEICAVLRGEDVRGQNPKHEAVVEAYETNPAGEFVDPWGTAYRIEVGHKSRVISLGPNRVDDHGSGDDIVAQ